MKLLLLLMKSFLFIKRIKTSLIIVLRVLRAPPTTTPTYLEGKHENCLNWL